MEPTINTSDLAVRAAERQMKSVADLYPVPSKQELNSKENEELKQDEIEKETKIKRSEDHRFDEYA
ncbi:MAG: hypothetical protein JXR48_13390 [Candidatus Delongbacteria bacterium]|nr:hypothetical protein [Candidatus Delongbacteria bacterium]MBN2835949.1 hypothetical protein [Candidatus Delongbacteria bacterium]